MKGGDQRHAEPNHDSAHDQGADDAPYQNAMLRNRWNLEVGEDKNENKDVIDAEGVLDQITGEKIQGAIRAQHFGDDQTKSEGEKYPQQAAQPSRAHRERTVTPFKTCQVDRNGNENAEVEGNPKPNTCRHRVRLSRTTARSNRKLRLLSRPPIRRM